MGTEIERKFLVTPTAEVPAAGPPAEPIRQGYLVVGATGETRLRDRGGRFTLTVKRGDGLVRGEWEVALTAEQFDALWPATEGARLTKTRREIPLGPATTASLDEYGGQLAGLRVVEVEFPDESAATAFTPPPWFGPELTGHPAYGNRHLATTPTTAVPALLAGPGSG
ncbi:CYTH domain-containing protein [Kitasatospora sp. LaBMicrA B282]|uniref:CYTH domain-containing protein n=1 Tax=Kitasatospora sp. LaBMicrA B282 TaxID=3420949 RepID=UPI003D09CA0F